MLHSERLGLYSASVVDSTGAMAMLSRSYKGIVEADDVFFGPAGKL